MTEQVPFFSDETILIYVISQKSEIIRHVVGRILIIIRINEHLWKH